MSTMNDFKCLWQKSNLEEKAIKPIDNEGLDQIVRLRTKKNLNIVMRYFWASFVLQMVVYALLVHVIAKYGNDQEVLITGIAGIVFFIPFTVILLRKFKAMATTRMSNTISSASIQAYVGRQYNLLSSFYRFKKGYEWVLVPLATAIGTFLTFKLYVPGGVYAYQFLASIIFAVTVISCAVAIKAENNKSFKRPLSDLQKIRDEFEKTENE